MSLMRKSRLEVILNYEELSSVMAALWWYLGYQVLNEEEEDIFTSLILRLEDVQKNARHAEKKKENTKT